MIPIMRCMICAHLMEGTECKAFKKIPDEILIGTVDHRKPYPGDNGIQFEAMKK